MMRWLIYLALIFGAVALGAGAHHVKAAEPTTVEIRPVAVDREKGTVTLTFEQLQQIIDMNNAAVDEAERLRAKTDCT